MVTEKQYQWVGEGVGIGCLYTKKVDTSNPPHYTQGTIEAIDYMKDNMSPQAFEGFLEGSVKKYLHRWTYKGKPLEDLKKAQWYLTELIKVQENK